MTCSGEGPALILVEPAGHHRGFSAFGGLVPLLGSAFTVVTYDRRGRGESGDTAPCAVRREVEDLAAVLESIMPPELVAGMRDGPAWQAMTQVAGTLVYDCMISTATDTDTLTDVGVPTLVLDSLGSSDDLSGMAAMVARHLPHAQHQRLPGGWHGVEDQALASALRGFLEDHVPGGQP